MLGVQTLLSCSPMGPGILSTRGWGRISSFCQLVTDLGSVFLTLPLLYQLSSMPCFARWSMSIGHKFLRLFLSSFRVSPFAYKILHLAGITGNELADSVARSALRLPFVVQCGVTREDSFLMLERDQQSWLEEAISSFHRTLRLWENWEDSYALLIGLFKTDLSWSAFDAWTLDCPRYLPFPKTMLAAYTCWLGTFAAEDAWKDAFR